MALELRKTVKWSLLLAMLVSGSIHLESVANAQGQSRSMSCLAGSWRAAGTKDGPDFPAELPMRIIMEISPDGRVLYRGLSDDFGEIARSVGRIAPLSSHAVALEWEQVPQHAILPRLSATPPFDCDGNSLILGGVRFVRQGEEASLQAKTPQADAPEGREPETALACVPVEEERPTAAGRTGRGHPLESRIATAGEVVAKAGYAAQLFEKDRNGYRIAMDRAFEETYGRAPTEMEWNRALDVLRNVEVLPTEPDSPVREAPYPDPAAHAATIPDPDIGPIVEIYLDRWDRADEIDQLNTLVHETTHVLSMLVNGIENEPLEELDDQRIMRRFAGHVLDIGQCQ